MTILLASSRSALSSSTIESGQSRLLALSSAMMRLASAVLASGNVSAAK
jgi:hypothetical protein